jgi:hypothetical protein
MRECHASFVGAPPDTVKEISLVGFKTFSFLSLKPLNSSNHNFVPRHLLYFELSDSQPCWEYL